LLLGLVAAVDWLVGRRRFFRAALVLAAVAFLAFCFFHERSLRIGTYNVRELGVAPTDMHRLAGIVTDLHADILAIEEIQDEERMQDLARRVSAGPRRMRAISSGCGGQGNMRVGFLYDEGRVELVATKEFPGLDPGGGGACDGRARPAFAATFRRHDERVTLIAFHLKAGGDARDQEERQKQWQSVFRIANTLRAADPESTVIALGDANTTGFLDNRRGERDQLLEQAREAKMTVATRDLPCSEYFQPGGQGNLLPSLLDHAVVSEGRLSPRSVEVHGFCRTLRCVPHAGDKPEDFVHVSDHCPVTLELQ
jgi:endonuclease/exonuclease/phosphatase family metal-dependent hydrolase